MCLQKLNKNCGKDNFVIPTSRPIRDTPGQALVEIVVAATRCIVVVPVPVEHVQGGWLVAPHEVQAG